MVSVTVDSVSVWLVIEPCWKLGTTGTALAVPTLPNVNANIVISLFIAYYWIDNSVTNCPVATVPAPPAVTVKAPCEVTVPAKDPAVPAAVDN